MLPDAVEHPLQFDRFPQVGRWRGIRLGPYRDARSIILRPGILGSRKGCDMTGESPRLGGGKRSPAKVTDRLQIQSSKSRKRPTEAEGRVLDAVTRMHFTDERGESIYEEALHTVRERPDEVRRAVENLERSSPDDHQLHWSLYYIVADLELPELAPMLVDGAIRDVPDITEATPCHSGEEDKILVAVMAVEGLERLARKEPDVAINALIEVVERQSNVAVRAAAVQAILSIRPDAAQDIARLLPDDQRFLLELRRVSVEQLTAIPERAAPGRYVHRSPKLPSDRNAPQGRTE